MARGDSKDHHRFSFLHGRKKEKEGRVKKGLGEALGAIGLMRPDDEHHDSSSVSSNTSSAHGSLKHLPSRESLKSIDMSLFNHLKRHKNDKISSSGSSSRSPSVEPPHSSSSHSTNNIPRIITTTDAPAIISRDLTKAPIMSRPAVPKVQQERSVSASTAASGSTIAAEDIKYTRPSALDRAKSAIMSRAVSPSPARQPAAPRGNHIVTDAVASFRPKLEAELKGSKQQSLAAGVSSEDLFGFIASERLRRMPARGSRWDKILKWAEDFAKKLSLFEITEDSFIPSSKEAVELILASIQLLLLLGPQNGEALERAFGIFHEYGLVFDFYKRNISLLVSISEARRYLSLSLADMLGLSVEMTLLYRKSSRGMSTASVTVDFNLTFGGRMESFVSHKDRIAELMWTWQLENSSEISDIHVSIESIRQWLLPQDHMLQALVSGRRATRTPRAEFSCEWLERPILDFARSKDKVLTITAEAGAGKSFLFGWILERLQRPVAHREYQVIQATVDSQVPSQATQIALVKSLLLQLLEQNVGNVNLFRCLANVTELGTNTSSTEDAEDALYFTLETALQGLQNVVLIIDGLDSLQGDEATKLRAFEHFYDIANKNQHNVRVIILTRPLSKPWPKPTRQVAITPQRTTADVKHMTRAWLVRRNIGTKQEIEDVSEQIAQRSKGSLTWADMSLQLLSKATTITEITTAVKELPSTTSEILAKHTSSILLKGDARLIISWLLASKRPLSTVEIQTLLELDITKTTHSPRSTDIVEDIKKACGSLVIIQDKTVRFRNETIRLHLLELSKKETKDTENALLAPEEANRDLTARLLLYVKTCVTRNVDSSLDRVSSREVESSFRTHPLLEYAARNWLSHFKQSTWYANGQIQPAVSAQLKGIFPNSTLLARLEQRCWDKQTLASNANSSHVLALTVRQQVLGENAQSVLQSCINVALSYKKISAPADASKYFYRASKIGQAVLGRTSALAVSCATASLDISAEVKDKATTRDEAVTQRQELLEYVIDTEKQRSGGNTTSALASKYTNELAELFTSIGETDKAEGVYREVYKATIAQNGQFSAEATRAAEKLQTVLYKEDKHDEIVEYQAPIFAAAQRNLEIFDIRRVDVTIRTADTYEKKKDFTHAEELYITLWRQLTEYCRSSATATASAASVTEAHERKIQISLAYAKFLRRQGRDSEAQSILQSVWLDYQQTSEHKSEAIAKQLNEVGEELKSMGILDTAIAVFKSVWGYFKGSGKQNSAEAAGTAVALMGAVQEKSEKKKAEAEKAKAVVAASGGVVVDTHEDFDEEEEEDTEEDDTAILDEVIKAAVAVPAAATSGSRTATKTKEVEVVTIESRIQTCETLSAYYISQQKWTEAIEVLVQMLKLLWPELGTPAKYGFPKAFRMETVKFTRRLAAAYEQSNQTEQAEKLYVAIFEASLRSGLKVQDEFVTESSTQLIEFHKKTQQWYKVLAVYQVLLEGYKTSLGARNALTIRTLYIMGDLCVQYKPQGYDASKYYLEIVKSDKSADGVISKETLPAAIAVSKTYYEQKRWVDLRPIYASLWVTFTKRAKEYEMSPELVQTIYKRYVTVLQTHLKVSVEEVRVVAVEYRETCSKVWGAQADITMSASLALVAISRKSTNVEHQKEAVKICEEVVAESEKQKAAAGGEGGKKAPAASAFQLSLLASAKRHLAGLYSVSGGVAVGAGAAAAAGGVKAKGVAVAVNAESAQKAETLWKEQLETNKANLGVAHKTTLASLSSLVGVWARSDKAEVRKQAQEKLDTSVVEVLNDVCVAGTANVDSTKLRESGVSLAKIYLSAGFSVQAWALLKQLRFHVVARGKIAGAADAVAEKTSLKLTDNIDRRSLVFIASFEETLRISEAETAKLSADKKVVKVTFSDIITDLLTESILYNRYSLTISTKAAIDQQLFDGARLYVFLKQNKEQHAEQLSAVEESLLKIFVDKFGASIKTDALVTRAFLIAIIEELGQRDLHEDNLVYISCTAITARVHTLLLADSYAQAVDLATAWYQFMVSQKGFSFNQTIPFAFKLSLYLAGLGVKTHKAADALMQSRMLELSKTILRETLTACKSMNIDLVQLQASELNSLVRLMGQQKNYEDLEWLLTQLWNSRIIQSSWSATTVIALGRRLVEVRFIKGKRDDAIALAESIAYNLRRTWGLLDAATVDMNNLLSALCVSDQRYGEALDVHEEILRALLDLNISGDNDNESDDAASELLDFDEENAAALALQQLELVRRIYGRNGGWPESEDVDMEQLTADVVDEFATGDESSKWSKTAPPAADTMGTFVAPQVWEFSLAEEATPGQPAAGGLLKKRPSHMLRSLQLSRQRSYGDLSEARKRLGAVESKSVSGNALLAAPVAH